MSTYSFALPPTEEDHSIMEYLYEADAACKAAWLFMWDHRDVKRYGNNLLKFCMDHQAKHSIYQWLKGEIIQ